MRKRSRTIIIAAIGIPIFLLGLWIASGYLPIRNIAMPSYTVLEKREGYEIRRYDAYVIAETGQRPREPGGTSGFKELFGYISGSNTGSAKIPMTSPVLKSADAQGQKIPMTTPVLKQKDAGSDTIAFVMPPGSTIDQLPRPTSQAISLKAIPPHKVAVVRFSGAAGAAVLKAKTKLLLAALQRDGVRHTSPPRIALYNPPWTPPFMRRNEVMVEID